eukprot:CAMPEP_0206540216 /NCGR_PEP_ID=MMETSP0325_2-20121206/8860_1 /ASSEMBLY_ACC=CAM_ASM_000347 /TAXON_ID=2866 /ORGANISM="Crypthecodinium cohnii, Strain Seligo" /LENGTH=408 /DNA_ID=CAMNT_0054037871 /DNA_START=324 /DNA_END=1551 /DNA_ORIENTATION=-
MVPEHNGEGESTWVARALVAPSMALALLFGSDVLSTLGFRDPLVFVDKVCIHQTDEDEKLKGISKLGAFLDCSDRMLILYSDVYLRKLWTIYEVATFLSLRSISAMDVVPVQMPAVIFGAPPGGYIFSSTLMLWRYLADADPGWLRYVLKSLFSFGFLMFLRRWAREKARTIVQLREFDVSDCTCAVEADREVIYAKIADLMCVVEERLYYGNIEVFNEKVRLHMPLSFGYMFGWTTFRYEHMLFISVVAIGTQSSDYAYFDSSSRWQQVLCYWLTQFTWVFCVWPAVIFSAEILSASFLSIRRFESLWIILCICILAAPSAVLHAWMEKMVERSIDDDRSVLLCAVVSCPMLISTWLLVFFHRRSRIRAAHHLETKSPHIEGSSPGVPASTGLSDPELDDNASVHSV